MGGTVPAGVALHLVAPAADSGACGTRRWLRRAIAVVAAGRVVDERLEKIGGMSRMIINELCANQTSPPWNLGDGDQARFSGRRANQPPFNRSPKGALEAIGMIV